MTEHSIYVHEDMYIYAPPMEAAASTVFTAWLWACLKHTFNSHNKQTWNKKRHLTAMQHKIMAAF